MHFCFVYIYSSLHPSVQAVDLIRDLARTSCHNVINCHNVVDVKLSRKSKRLYNLYGLSGYNSFDILYHLYNHRTSSLSSVCKYLNRRLT